MGDFFENITTVVNPKPAESLIFNLIQNCIAKD